MFLGHFGVGFAAKSVAPRVSLGSLFLASQLIDLLWPSFLLLGIERVKIVPGATAVTPLIFERYPYSHSLVAVLFWAVVVAGAYMLVRRQWRSAVVLGCLVVSHWLLDALVHQPDLPLTPMGETRVGLSGWSSLPTTLAIEGGLFALGMWRYTATTSARDGVGRWGLVALVALLLAIYAGNLFGPPPPTTQAIAWAGQMQWLLVGWGYWIDRHRSPSRRQERLPWHFIPFGRKRAHEIATPDR